MGEAGETHGIRRPLGPDIGRGHEEEAQQERGGETHAPTLARPG